jgi:hypothetical protein
VLAEAAFNGNRLSASDGRILLRLEVSDADDWFTVGDLNANGRMDATFRAEGTWGLLSEDGATAVVYSDGISLEDLRTAAVRQLTKDVDNLLRVHDRKPLAG